MKSVGQVIKARREELSLTLEAVARVAGLTKSYLSMVENGKVANPPSDAALAAIERALEIADGELRRVAAWQNTPPQVRERIERLEDQARHGRDLARWLKQSTGKRADGARNLDKLFTSGELSRRVNEALRKPRGESHEAAEPRGPAAKKGSSPGVAKGASSPGVEQQAKSGGVDQRGDKSTTSKGAIDASVPVLFRVPLINRVAAGYPDDFTDLDYPARVADEYVSCPGVNDPSAFAARVVGDSMLPDYREGDIVVFSPRAKPTDGCDCFVRLEPDHQTTFKRVFFEKQGRREMIRLQPLNPRFAPRAVERKHVSGLYRAVMVMHAL